MTEEEVKMETCIGPARCGLNGLCIGSRCRMAWRWEGPQAADTVVLDSKDERPSGPGWVFRKELRRRRFSKEDPFAETGEEHLCWAWERPRPRHGYCGLASKP